MNGTEEWYYNTYLLPRLSSGKLIKVLFERFQVVLTHPDSEHKKRASTYLPDFYCLRSDGEVEIHEVKGFSDEADLLKFKHASELFNEFHWFMIHITKNVIKKIDEY